jgi:hypothetical protein
MILNQPQHILLENRWTALNREKMEQNMNRLEERNMKRMENNMLRKYERGMTETVHAVGLNWKVRKVETKSQALRRTLKEMEMKN